jgi:hypothetical protein
MANAQNIKNEPMLPVGDRPFWDLNGPDNGNIKSISERWAPPDPQYDLN